jgi:hypothetical protein
MNNKGLVKILCTLALLLLSSAAMSEAFKLPDTGQYGTHLA